MNLPKSLFVPTDFSVAGKAAPDQADSGSGSPRRSARGAA